MFALGNRPRIRQKHLKSSGDRRRLQEARAVYNTRLRLEPLEERRLLSVVTYTTATKLLDFTADVGKSDNVIVSTPADNEVRVVVGNGDAITLAGDAVANPDFVLSTTTTANDTLTISTAPANSPLATFNINLGDQSDTLAFGLANASNGVTDVNIDGGADTDILNLSTSTLGGSLTVDQTETTNLSGTITTTGAQDYKDKVVLTADTVLTGVGITFEKTLDSDATARTLAINDSGTTLFGDKVGDGSALASLITDAAGATQIDGGAITTTGAQTYQDPVTQGDDAHLTGSTLAAGPSWDAAWNSL